MRRASTAVLVGLGLGLAATPAAALDTIPFCDKITAPNDRMACLQAHISHLEESILGLSAQIADLNNQLRDKSNMETAYKMVFSQGGKCLGQDDQKPAYVSCTDPDAFSLMERTKTGLTKKPVAAAAPVTPEKPKKAKDKNKAAANSDQKVTPNANQPAGGAVSKPATPPAQAPGQAVPKSSQ